MTDYAQIVSSSITYDKRKERRGKEEYLYSAFRQRLVSKRSDMDHTVLPANYTVPLPFLRKRSPDGASTECGGEHLIAVHLSLIHI